MDLLQLRYFQAVARHEHVSRAASELRVAQPSLSRALARLESDLGVPLFDRRGRRLVLNRFGAAFLARVDAALDELSQGRRELDDLTGLEHGAVAVALETMLLLPDLLASFLAEHPGISFQLRQSPTPAMADLLHAGQVDFCLASQPVDDELLEVMELASAEVLLAVPLTHRLAGREVARVADLADEVFVGTRRGYWQRALIDQLFAQSGRQPVISCESDEPGSILPLVAAGLGVGLVPAMSRQSTSRQGVAWVHLDAPDCRHGLRLVWRRGVYLSAAAQAFRDAAIAWFREPTRLA
ncbi:LysR family transcriptional regulator [Streptomyces sp. NPDC056161]|uniref:LysR family transcriptional regulator n=1 Tax=Streptomyces sp. NPDC056161 TaxID=3345732 RepID=UPI0035DE15E8